MHNEENVALIHRFVAGFNAGNPDVIDEFMSSALRVHVPAPPGGSAPTTRAELKASLSAILTALPDWHETVDVLVPAGDKVAWRWTLTATNLGPLGPIPPSGRPVRFSGIEIWRFAAGQVVELWNETDVLGFIQQLGLIPTP